MANQQHLDKHHLASSKSCRQMQNLYLVLLGTMPFGYLSTESR